MASMQGLKRLVRLLQKVLAERIQKHEGAVLLPSVKTLFAQHGIVDPSPHLALSLQWRGQTTPVAYGCRGVPQYLS